MKIDDELKGHFRNDFHRGAINLNYTAKYLNYSLLQFMKKHNLTEPQYNILRVLRGYKSEKSISVNFIKERMLDKNSDVSRLIDKMMVSGLVDRQENQTDRRQKLISITEKGLGLLNEMHAGEIELDKLLHHLTLQEVQELNRLLDKIRG